MSSFGSCSRSCLAPLAGRREILGGLGSGELAFLDKAPERLLANISDWLYIEFVDATYKAIADPSRRAILDLLAEGERTVNDLLGYFSFSQPALSQHLKVLRDAGLVGVRQEGRLRHYSLQVGGLRSVADWVVAYERFWTEKLDVLGDVLDRESARTKSRSRKRR